MEFDEPWAKEGAKPPDAEEQLVEGLARSTTDGAGDPVGERTAA